MNTNLIHVAQPLEVGNKRFFNHSFIKTAMAIALIATIGLSTVNNYGVSWDESLHIKNVRANYEFILKNKPLPKHPADIKYYGVAFDIAAETLYQLKNGLNPRIEINPDRVVLKHALTFLFSLLAYAAVAGIVSIFCGAEYAWLGPITLALFPGFWGHSFFNPKDIPFAVLFTLSTWMGAYLVEGYSKLNEKVKIGFNRFSITSILFGVLVGLLTSARIGGFVFLGFIPLTYIVTRVGIGKITIDTYKNVFISWILIFISWAIVTTVCHPVSWSNPVGWFLEAVKYHSKHGWGGTVLFDGELILGSQLPWYYLPRIVTITVPEIILLLFIIGLGLSAYKYSQLSNLQKACLILVLLQILSLSIYAIVKGSTLYDGIRQFLFILPAIAAISGSSIAWLWKKYKAKFMRFFGLGLMAILCLQICFDMINLHPYQYIYFNRLSGGLIGAYNRYDTDYWGLSLREAMEWVNKNSKTGRQVLVAGPLDSAKIFAKPGISVEAAKLIAKPGSGVVKLKESNTSKPDYYLAIPKWNLEKAFPECQVVYQVVRQGVPLTTVKRCD